MYVKNFYKLVNDLEFEKAETLLKRLPKRDKDSISNIITVSNYFCEFINEDNAEAAIYIHEKYDGSDNDLINDYLVKDGYFAIFQSEDESLIDFFAADYLKSAGENTKEIMKLIEDLISKYDIDGGYTYQILDEYYTELVSEECEEEEDEEE